MRLHREVTDQHSADPSFYTILFPLVYGICGRVVAEPSPELIGGGGYEGEGRALNTKEKPFYVLPYAPRNHPKINLSRGCATWHRV